MDRVGVEASLLVAVCFIIMMIMLPFTTHVYADSQAAALMALKKGLFDPTNALSTWNSTNVNPCGWKHIMCDPPTVVKAVDISASGLEGPLVSQLGNLTKLQYLVMFNNKINGSIPTELGMLAELQALALYGNSLTGSVPEELGNRTKMPYLRFLLLNDNQLSGPLPKAIENLPEESVVMNFTGNSGLCGKFADNKTCT